jgi:hypothetical protein
MNQTIGADHFGEHQPGAIIFHDQPVGQIADSGHGSQAYGVDQIQGTYFHETMFPLHKFYAF